MKRIISILGFLSASIVAFCAPAAVQTDGVGGPLLKPFSTGTNTGTVSAGGTLNASAGTLTLADNQIPVAKVNGAATSSDLAGKANLAGGNTFTGTQNINSATIIQTNGNQSLNINEAGINISNSDSEEEYEINSLTYKLKTNNQPTAIFLKEGNLWAFGDSQTAGTNYAVKPYTSGGYLLPEYRWVNMLANWFGKEMSVNNLAIGGTGMSWDPASDPYFWRSHFNRFAYLQEAGGVHWSGTLVAMMGYNSIVGTVSDKHYVQMRKSYFAFVARALADDFFGVTHLGWKRDSTSSDQSCPGWATSVTTTTNREDSSTNEFNPFPVNSLQYPNNAITLGSGDYVEFSLTDYLSGKRECAVFFETDPNGGEYIVKVNGIEVARGTTEYSWDDAPDLEGHSFPVATWLYGLPINAVIRVEIPSGATYSVLWKAAGVIPDFGEISDPRQVIIAGPVSNTAGGKTLESLYKMGKQAESAVFTLSSIGHPVQYSNTYNAFVLSSDQEPTDPAHLRPIGNVHIAQAFSFSSVPSSEFMNSECVNVESIIYQKAKLIESGNVSISSWAIDPTYARIGHKDFNTSVGYGLLQKNDGSVYLDSSAFNKIQLSSGGNARLTAESDGVHIPYISNGYVTASEGTGRLLSSVTIPGTDISGSVPTATALATPRTINGVSFNGTANITVPGKSVPVTVATLPVSPAAGDWSAVTDALAPTYGATVVGGGAIVTPVWYDGANWTCR